MKTTTTKAAQARVMYDAGGYSVAEIAETFGVNRVTICPHLATHLDTA